jgi:DNA-binding NtrC family response regulator
MSSILPIEPIENVSTSDKNPQPMSGKETIGITCIASSENSTLRKLLDQAELQLILRALQHTGWNRKRAAASLKISYRGLLYKIRRHGITPPLTGDRDPAA